MIGMESMKSLFEIMDACGDHKYPNIEKNMKSVVGRFHFKCYDFEQNVSFDCNFITIPPIS